MRLHSLVRVVVVELLAWPGCAQVYDGTLPADVPADDTATVDTGSSDECSDGCPDEPADRDDGPADVAAEEPADGGDAPADCDGGPHGSTRSCGDVPAVGACRPGTQT
mgnify:FL=1